MTSQSVILGHRLKMVGKALLGGVLGTLLLVPCVAVFVWLLFGNAPVYVYLVIYIAITSGLLWRSTR